MKFYITLLILLFPLGIYSQYVLENESVIYSFKTKGDKKMVLVKDNNNKYIQYRFGTKSKIEMQFPAKRTEESWKQFHYIFYSRGGGKANSGQEIANLSFTKDGYQYLIYDTYFSENEKLATGILFKNLKLEKTTRINGIIKKRVGSLFSLNLETPLEFDESLGFEF